MNNDAKPKQAWAVKMDELVNKYGLDNWKIAKARTCFADGYKTCRAEMQNELAKIEPLRELNRLGDEALRNAHDHYEKLLTDKQKEIDELKEQIAQWKVKNEVLKWDNVQIELAKRDIAIEKMKKVIEENTCYDPCGFEPQNESHETLVDCFKVNDMVARETLAEIKKIMGEV